VELELFNNPATCPPGPNGGRVEVHARRADAPAFVELMRAERARLLEGLPDTASDAVIDMSQANATCPACGTEFATTATECPECGLGFSVPAGVEE
jgi:hypothetical protein